MSEDRALEMDGQDPLADFRQRFHIPLTESGEEEIYLSGNSLGLQPRSIQEALDQEVGDWARLGVAGHFGAKQPWYSYHEDLCAPLARLVGAQAHEVVPMGALTSNLHLAMVSFYRPTRERSRILIEAGAFPSDRYAVESQARFHGLDPSEAVVSLGDEGDLLDEAEIEAYLEAEGTSIALVMVGGVHYYTGQLFDMGRIARAAHRAGATVGFDLAHAIGNVPLSLHDWGVDFAAWCSYKYLNSGPGGVAGLFVHDRHAGSDLPRFNGWWGTDPETRFEMGEFEAQRGAAAWQVSNAPVMSMACHRAALAIHDEAGMPALREKSLAMTDFLLAQLDGLPEGCITVISPRQADRRGSQVSLRIHGDASVLHRALVAAGVACDFRNPDVIRMAPAPLYNRFHELWRVTEILRAHLS
ncbi:MAG: kynureninase [Candidatus Thalassarchaeaceae archaeon]|jgi:kynureninase|nr:kynureninase [Candidatus Thalassarchaeaceae archaeon]MDP7003887.1 kynureninase [Candidatus Thalassarchaeaceae archaeon]